MRTTVTLDPDVACMLEKVMKDRGISFEQAVNDAVRTGLAARRRKHRFVQKTYSLGSAQQFHWDKALATADAIEDKERVRRLPLCK